MLDAKSPAHAVIISTEPIGSIPRGLCLIEAFSATDSDDPMLDPRIEMPEEIRDRILEAARYIPLEQLGTTDDCGFSPFSDDTSTSRETAFAKIRARVEGTALAAEEIGDG